MTPNASIGQFSNVAVCAQPSLSLDKVKSLYRADQQVKLLDLQAEAESLLRQLQALKQQRTD